MVYEHGCGTQTRGVFKNDHHVCIKMQKLKSCNLGYTLQSHILTILIQFPFWVHVMHSVQRAHNCEVNLQVIHLCQLAFLPFIRWEFTNACHQAWSQAHPDHELCRADRWYAGIHVITPGTFHRDTAYIILWKMVVSLKLEMLLRSLLLITCHVSSLLHRYSDITV